MKFSFDATQEYQLSAIESAVALFNGQTVIERGLELVPDGDVPVIGNQLTISDEQLLSNLQEVQEANGLPADAALEFLEGADEDQKFANFTVEMETGSGKTYVYVRTALELFRRCGLRKFIIVVPTIAIRAGVFKTFEITREHFGELYPDVPYRFQAYDSRFPGRIRQFATSLSVEFLVMTIDSFNKDSNRLFAPSDQLNGEAAVRFAQATRPILILDEPQNMGSDNAIEALGKLHPLFALRYSATHREKYNLIYRLTPIEAYRRGIVKQIEVAGVERESDANRAYMVLDGIKAGRRKISAQLTVHALQGGGLVREKQIRVQPGSDLEEITGRQEYGGYVVDEVNPATATIRFVNNIELRQGESIGKDTSNLFDAQIRYTIREHFFKQRRLVDRGIKVLSLFFIDRVSNYSGDAPVIRMLFDRAFEELKHGFPEWEAFSPDEVQAAYFAKKRRRGGREDLIDTVTGSAEHDKEAFDLIMRNKERLLSLEEPVAFIFSHSALREGWDNPNICQICTLNQTVSETKKRQEIGRGLRLVVDQNGRRSHEPELNVLTVVANDSYENYVSKYQSEIEQDFGREDGPPRIENARKRGEARLREDMLRLPEFEALWERLSRKTAYVLRLDVEERIPEILEALESSDIQPIRVRVAKGRIIAGHEEEFEAQVISGSRTVATAAPRASLDDVLDKAIEHLARWPAPLRISKRTILRILKRTSTSDLALANPHGWALAFAEVVREVLADQVVTKVEYQETGARYALAQFDSVICSWRDRMQFANKGIYDHTIFESDVERRFAEHLDRDSRTVAFMKFPSWFVIETPVGPYTPDWMIIRKELDEHGELIGTIPLIAETKGTLEAAELRPKERRKIACAERHFQLIGLRYRTVRSLSEYDVLDDLASQDAEA